MTAVMENYNTIAGENGWTALTDTYFNYTINMPCTVSGILDETYGKVKDDSRVDNGIVMEFEPFLQYLSLHLPANMTNPDFLTYL